MVDQIAVVTFTTPAAPGTIDVTDPSITQTFSAAILIYSGFTGDDTDNAHGILGIGFIAPDTGDSPVSTDQGHCAHAQNGQNTTPNCGTRESLSAAAVTVGDATTNNAATGTIVGGYSASIAGGVRINFTTTTVQAKCTAILFAGLSGAFTDGCTGATGGAHENCGNTTKFTPDLVIFAASDAALNTNNADAAPNLGFALNLAAIQQVCAYVNADDATEPSDADGFVRSANAFGHFVAGGSRAGEFDTVTSFDATGFNHTSTVGSPDSHYLALKFSGAVRLACANLAVAAAGGNQAFNAFGFTPDLVLGMSTLLAVVDTTTDGPTASTSGYFVTGRYGSRAYTWHHEEGITLAGAVVANAHSRQSDAAVLQYNHTGTIVQQASWAGASGSGGFVLNFSTASAAGFLTALGIQLIPNPPLPVRRPRRARRARARLRRRIPLIGGKPVGNPPLVRMLQAVARMRRKALARLRRHVPFRVPTAEMLIGAETDEGEKGRIVSAGLLRGRVVAPGMNAPEDESL